jgi:hypothetical protein
MSAHACHSPCAAVGAACGAICGSHRALHASHSTPYYGDQPFSPPLLTLRSARSGSASCCSSAASPAAHSSRGYAVPHLELFVHVVHHPPAVGALALALAPRAAAAVALPGSQRGHRTRDERRRPLRRHTFCLPAAHSTHTTALSPRPHAPPKCSCFSSPGSLTCDSSRSTTVCTLPLRAGRL